MSDLEIARIALVALFGFMLIGFALLLALTCILWSWIMDVLETIKRIGLKIAETERQDAVRSQQITKLQTQVAELFQQNEAIVTTFAKAFGVTVAQKKPTSAVGALVHAVPKSSALSAENK